jgi:hypothetical protein
VAKSEYIPSIVNPYCADGRCCGYPGHEDPLSRLDWNHRHCAHCDQGMALGATACRECELELMQLAS